MSAHAYTENQLVEQPAIQLFAALGWQTVSTMEEAFGANGTLSRETSGEVVLVGRLRAALEKLNASRMGHDALQPQAIDYVRTRNQRDPQYRYNADELYDHTVRRLFKERLPTHDGYCIRFAIRSNSHRTTALREALEGARTRFAQERGVLSVSQLDVKAAYPTEEVALQAVDYFLWALQRVFEKREDRFLELLWPQCSLIVDVDDTREKEYGAYYTKQKPLRAAALKDG